MNLGKVNQKIMIGTASNMEAVQDKSVHLVVTSPPYPMIEMWDEIMSRQNPQIATYLNSNDGPLAFELMHQELDKVWREVERILVPGGFACINIGDATRTLDGNFTLYSNHTRIISAFLKLGLSNLPNIIWRKQTNAPNKFMGSGMLPAGAYVTLEHEWILIFRKGNKRILKSEEDKRARQESAFFWEERNSWFSDLWDLKGTRQKIDNSETRKRSAAYPFEIPYRLINMYSLKGDTVLDPFLGTGTTLIAASAAERNGIGYEIDPLLLPIISEGIETTSIEGLNNVIQARIDQHELFIAERAANPSKDEPKHFNENFNIPVITSQEVNMKLSFVNEILKVNDSEFTVTYSQAKPKDFKKTPKKKNQNETLF